MQAIDKIKLTIEDAFAQLISGDATQIAASLQDPALKDAVKTALDALDQGHLSVMQKTPQGFVHNEWLKKAILLFFRMTSMKLVHAGELTYVDKVPVKNWQGDEGVRVVPQALVRYGSYVARGAVIMPAFVNIGAYVGEGSMVDTWATVGSCAYIGKNVHLSGGVGVGGVLEPIQAKPVVVEDNAFVGSRSILVEGAHIEENAVIGAGVTITGSTKIIDVTGSEPTIMTGRVPASAVVIPGSYPKSFPAGTYHVPCALIIGQRSAGTNQKTSLTAALREFSVPV